MKTFFRFLKYSVVAAAIALLSFNSSAHAGFYQGKLGQNMVVTANNGVTYLIFNLGGFYWGVPSSDPSYAVYAAMVNQSIQTGSPFVYGGCSSPCTAVTITAQGLGGSWTLWYPTLLEP
jgi:hypothetical protein